MIYNLKWKPEAEQEFSKLDKSLQQQAFTQFKKLQHSPELGQKLYFFQKKYRIVYKINPENDEVIIFAVGKRENLKIYQELAERLKNFS